MDWWHGIVYYYKSIGEKYHVDPVIFVGIHIVATPVFAAAVWWLIYQKRRKKSIVFPVFMAILVFNAANLYLIFLGIGIPLWIYLFVGVTTAVSTYFTIQKIRKKLSAQRYATKV